mgnify:CR=1 FL=1
MAKRKQIEDDYRDSSDAKMQQAMLLLKRKNVKYKPIPKFKGGCNNC